MIVNELSNVFLISDISFYQVQLQLKNTPFFKLEWQADVPVKELTDPTFNDCTQVTFITDASDSENPDLKTTDTKTNNVSNKAKVVLFNGVTWKVLFDFMQFCRSNAVSLGLGKLVKPTDPLDGAISFNVNAPINSQTKLLLNEWAENQNVELCCLDNAPTINQPGLLVMDMDSTAIDIECIDEIAKLAGVGEQVSEVTAAAMRGELDFAESLHARVATLTDAPVSIIDQVADNLPLMPGLENLVTHLQSFGWKLVIASGGFTYMTDVLKRQLNLDATVANQLEMKDGKLTGKVLGRIVDANVKAETIVSLAKEYNIELSQTIAMGDGANDLVMMAAAQLGVAFHAKPLVRKQADVSVKKGGLDQLLYLL
jgi:phosphoserine phosphatase